LLKFVLRNHVLTSCLFLLLATQSQAQIFPRGNGISMTGIDRFDAYVEIVNWTGLPQDRQEFRLNTQRFFESGLEAAGAPRRVASKDYLVCRVQATMAGELVAYTAKIEYWLMNSVGAHSLLWESGSISAAESTQFNEELVASQCVKYFADEWLKWNPQ